MSDKTEQKTVETVYGTVTIDVATCDSCGDTIAKKDAHDFTLGDRHGYACDYCVDEGPLSFPDAVIEAVGKNCLPRDPNGDFLKPFLVGSVFYPLIVLMIFIYSVRGLPSNDDHYHFGSGVMLGTMWSLIWTALVFFIWLVFFA